MNESETAIPLRTHDMYGHEIHPIGETGYGVSMALHWSGNDSQQPWMPMFTVFHASDGFQQCLFCVSMDAVVPQQTDRDRPQVFVHNIFEKRIADLIRLRPHGSSSEGLL